MPGKNKTPLLGWHPPSELSAWLDEEIEYRLSQGADLRGMKSQILNEALAAYLAKFPRRTKRDT